MKSKLESLFVILVMLLSIANIKICGDAIMRLNDNTQNVYITQGEIKSKQYLVTDEYISRISPKTQVELFVMQLGLENKEIAIYEDENKAEEVKDGLISTGMIMTVKNTKEEIVEKTEETNENEENINSVISDESTEELDVEVDGKEETIEKVKESDYELSVVGDINQDGRANIVEVVQIINHIVGLEGKEISGIKLVSSDVNADNAVNIIDINKLIRYIVFEELEIGEVGAPKAPTIGVEGQAKNGWYREDIKVSIVTNEEKFKKTIYSIDGEKFETTNKVEEKTIKQEGIHEIEAYTYGTIGNKSLTVEEEIKIDKESPVIEVINKSIEEETEGPVVIEIKASDKLSGLDEEAYSFDGGATWQKTNKKEYTKNVEEIKIQVRDKAGNISEGKTSIENIVEPKPRYNVVFKNYDGTTLQEEQLEEGTLPEYKGETPQKEKRGYNCTFIKWDKDIAEVIADIEYIATYTEEIINYTITYELNGGIVENENPSSYNVETETFKLNNPTKEDYIFKGWTLNDETDEIIDVSIEKGSIENRKYTANWKESNNVAQNVDSGKKYETIKLALEEQKDGETIKILCDVEEQVEILEGKKVILDLNGKIISSSSLEKPTLINNGELKIVDNATGEGRIENLDGKAVVNEANALLIMGNKEENEEEIKVEPGPYIEGTEIGLLDKGIFEFYDGTIIGKANSLIGVVDFKQDGYVPLIGSNEAGTKEVAKLGIRTDAVAVMNNTYYKTLEEAIEAAKINSEESSEDIKQEIIMLKNATLSNSIEIETYMDIKIDLKSYQISLSSTNKEYMINNGGKLEISDTSADKTGKIVSSTVNTLIKNKKTAELKLLEGTISNEKDGESSAYNKVISNTGKVIINGSKILSNASYMALVDNSNEVQILGGELISKASNSINNKANAKLIINGGNIYAYDKAILNCGDVELNEGTIEGYYAIDNQEMGTALINGGTIKGSYGIYNQSKGKEYKDIRAIKINKVSIETTRRCVYNYNSEGTIEINGGTFNKVYNSNYYEYDAAISNGSAGNINICNASITASTGIGALNGSNGNINIENTTISTTNRNGIYNDSSGNINIENTIISTTNKNGIYNDSNGNINIENVTITSKSGSGIYNNSNGNINIEDATITATSGNGIYNNSGKVNIKKGTIESNTTYGISNSSGNIILGIDDEIIYPSVYPNENSQEEYPIIKGKGYGIYNNGKLEYYDGVIFVDATSKNAIYGPITSMESGSNVVYNDIVANEQEGIEEKHYAIARREAICTILDEAGNVIINQNGEETTCTNINDALVNCQDGYTIKMVVEKYYLPDQIEIKADKNIKLDLNGCNIITGDENIAIINNGSLEILNSDIENEGIITTTYTRSLIDNKGKLTISGGKISNTKTTNKDYLINNYGELIINNGNLENTHVSYTISNLGKTTINGGDIKGYKGIYNNGNELIINGGTITASSEYAIYNISDKKIEINNGTIYSSGQYAIYNNEIGTIEINGGTITADRYTCTAIHNLGSLNISGGEIYADGDYSSSNNYYSYGIENKGKLIITGGNVKADGDIVYGIYNYSTAKILNINGGIIKERVVNCSNEVVTINNGLIEKDVYNDGNGMINMTGGQVTGGFTNYGVANITGGTIRNDGNAVTNNGTLNLGINDKYAYPEKYPTDEVNYPIIRGTTYGVYNNEGIFNYYDGIIFANNTSVNAIYGAVTTTADIYDENDEFAGKYDIIFKDETINNTVEHYTILGKDAICILLDSNGEIVKTESGETIKYYNLNDAIKNCEENYTIKFIRTINFKENLQIGGDKKVKLDLNGQNITVANTEYFIKNNGNLEIIDSDGTGRIITDTCEKIIENNGYLKINARITNLSSGKVIDNKDEVTIVGGEITGEIYNKEEGNLIVSGGEIIGKINNLNNGNITITGGELKGRINNSDNGNITVSGNAKIEGIDSTSSGTINIKENASINSSGTGIYNEGTGNINIEGNVYIESGVNGIDNRGPASVNIEGETSIFAEKYGIYNYGNGKVYIKGKMTIFTMDSGPYYYREYTVGIYNGGNGYIEIESVKITSIGNKTDGLVNCGTAKILSATIDSDYCGIDNLGILEVMDGNIFGDDYGISNEGTISLGEKDKAKNPINYPNDENKYPIIKGGSYGIYTTGTFNYYDGIILANASAVNAIYGVINDVAEIYNESDEKLGEYDVIYKDIEANTEEGIEEKHYVILGQEMLCNILDSNNNVVKNDEGNNLQYDSLSEAVKNCQEGYTIQIIKNVNLREKIEIEGTKNIKIDLNGNKIIVSNKESIVNNGVLEILDSSTEGTGEIISDFVEHEIISNSKTLIIKSGNIKTTNGKGINNIGNLEMSGGSIQSTIYGINSVGSIKISGGNINSTTYGIYSIGSVEISGGKLSATTYGIYNDGNTEISGGSINATIYGIYSAKGDITVSGGSITASYSSSKIYGIYSEGEGNITIRNGSINASNSYKNGNAYGIYVDGDGNIIIENGKINGSSYSSYSSYYGYGIYNNKPNKITVLGGTITASDYSIYNYKNGDILISGGTTGTINNLQANKIEITGGTISRLSNTEGNVIITNGEITNSLYNKGSANITGGNIKKVENNGSGAINILGGTIGSISNAGSGVINIECGNIITDSGNAVYNDGGIINIGKYDGEISKEIPQIKSTSAYGIYNNSENGRVNFYDGVIIGKTNAIYGGIKIPEEYKMNSVKETIELIEDLEICTLENKGDSTSQIRINETYYDSLQKAINNCLTGEEIITIEGNVIITEAENVTIGETQTITINLNGFTISGPIINNGALNIQNIVDGEQKEVIDESYGEVTNNGTLNIQQNQQ